MNLDTISFGAGLVVICWCLLALTLGLIHPLLALVLVVINGWCCWVIYQRRAT